jgi:hypothetical protein
MPTQPAKSVYATTLRIPNSVYEQAKQLVESETAGAASLNDFFVNAIHAYVKLCERRRIDAAFAAMADDAAYQDEAILLADEFAASDWEALEAAAHQPTPQSTR